MSTPPDWLEALQARFGEVLRTPLDRATGTLASVPEAYPEEAVQAVRGDARARLGVYNRQYWYRLFTALQTVFPLTTHLLGAWAFNAHAARFLLAHPPRGWDLEEVPEGFDRYFAAAIAGRDHAELLTEAARLDAAWRALAGEPPAVPFGPRPEDLAALLDARLVRSPSVLLWEERWGLLERKVSLVAPRSDEAAEMPPRHASTRYWCLRRDVGGVWHVPLEAGEGELLALLSRRTFIDALAEMESRCAPSERRGLADRARRWLAWSVERGLWKAVDFGDQRRTQV